MSDWNTYFNRVRMSHRMARQDVVECCRLGGLEVSSSRAEGWARGRTDTRRHVCMTEAEFDSFTRGLPDWARMAYDHADG